MRSAACFAVCVPVYSRWFYRGALRDGVTDGDKPAAAGITWPQAGQPVMVVAVQGVEEKARKSGTKVQACTCTGHVFSWLLDTKSACSIARWRRCAAVQRKAQGACQRPVLHDFVSLTTQSCRHVVAHGLLQPATAVQEAGLAAVCVCFHVRGYCGSTGQMAPRQAHMLYLHLSSHIGDARVPYAFCRPTHSSTCAPHHAGQRWCGSAAVWWWSGI